MSDARTAMVGVLGTGTMGPQIAVALASSGLDVTIVGRLPSDPIASKLRLALRWQARRLGGEAPPSETVLSRIRMTQRLEDLSEASMVIEAVTEDLAVKQDLFAQLEALTAPDVVLASNTSSLDLLRIAERVNHSERVLGLHFFNPIPETGLVEVLVTPRTSAASQEEAIALVHRLEKIPMVLTESCVNRILIPMINEACRALEQGLTSAPEMDRALKLGANHPIGPLALADLIGVDVVVAILRSLQAKLGSFYEPAPLLLSMVRDGRLGRKSGEGFFTYGRSKRLA